MSREGAVPGRRAADFLLDRPRGLSYKYSLLNGPVAKW